MSLASFELLNIEVGNMQLSSLEFIHPMWLLALPLPWLIYKLIPAYRTKKQATKVPFFSVLVEAIGEPPSDGAHQLKARWWQRFVLISGWLLVILALTKPMVLGEPQTRERYGRDIMVVLDLSGSMAEKDFVSSSGKSVNRLDAAKQVLNEFVDQRESDRLGMILFGDAAFVQAPFTADHTVWKALLSETEVAMAGPSTLLGDVIGLAIKMFEIQAPGSNAAEHNAREKVVIVLTDGNDTGSFVAPIDAAKVAAVKGVRIHMIAMGNPQTVGEQALDMDTINRVASETGGESFEALDRDALLRAYQVISDLEPTLYESTTYRPKQSLHHYLVSLVIIIVLLAFVIASILRVLTKKTTPRVKADTQIEAHTQVRANAPAGMSISAGASADVTDSTNDQSEKNHD
ncbi:aerotolerance regulator BatA [Vibrio sp. 10N.286.49.C2]|nr:aerotolerance regulator BatA [Vibrio sp. 10N.286.49.C2]PMH51371.1 aerotolerance regulator BatA [Vibrio sp. 10N.286.49.B1]PMH78658.1 aerotolerance regulator BatA [Vibrio sp. 10N.286.48.B7]